MNIAQVESLKRDVRARLEQSFPTVYPQFLGSDDGPRSFNLLILNVPQQDVRRVKELVRGYRQRAEELGVDILPIVKNEETTSRYYALDLFVAQVFRSVQIGSLTQPGPCSSWMNFATVEGRARENLPTDSPFALPFSFGFEVAQLMDWRDLAAYSGEPTFSEPSTCDRSEFPSKPLEGAAWDLQLPIREGFFKAAANSELALAA